MIAIPFAKVLQRKLIHDNYIALNDFVFLQDDDLVAIPIYTDFFSGIAYIRNNQYGIVIRRYTKITIDIGDRIHRATFHCHLCANKSFSRLILNRSLNSECRDCPSRNTIHLCV